MESEETKFLDKSSNLFVPQIEMNTHTHKQNNYLNTNICWATQKNGKFSLLCL